MRKKLLVFTVVLLSIFIAACSNDTENDEEVEERAIPVEVTQAVIDDFIVERSVTGRIEPKDISPVLLQMPGDLTELKVKNGDKVEKDDVIARVQTEAGTVDIKASESGEIMELSAKEDDILSGEDPLAMITNFDELKIGFTVTNHVRKLFELDETYDVRIEKENYSLTIDKIGKIPGETGLYPVEGTVKNKDEQVLPGMIGMVKLPENKVGQAIILPTEAIVEENDGSFVYKVDGDQVKKLEVTVVETQSDLSAIEGDITEDDEIVINGQLMLSDGSKIVIEKEENES